MNAAELRDLAADIQKNGLRVSILRTKAKQILDGRNRDAACAIAGVKPRYEEWDGKGSPIDLVLSLNLWRRHLNETQRGLAAAKAVRLMRELEPTVLASAEANPPIGGLVQAAAERMNVSKRSVERGLAVLDKATKAEIAEMESGEKSLHQVEKKHRLRELGAAARRYRPPVGEWSVISIDIPWKYEDELGGSDEARGGLEYPTMDIEAACELEIPVAKDSAVWSWTTHQHFLDPRAHAQVVLAWEKRYSLKARTFRTWLKTDKSGKPKMGLGRILRNVTEHLVLFTRGNPVFSDVTQLTEFAAPIGKHSEKPQKAYDDIVAKCPAGAYLEMFARARRPGWTAHGIEAPRINNRRTA